MRFAEKNKQLEEFTKLAEPVLEWLKAGANHVQIDEHSVGFNMGHVAWDGGCDYNRHDCGTAMCIAGAVDQFNNLGYHFNADTSIINRFHHIRGELQELFYPHSEEDDDTSFAWDSIKPDVAAVVLEHFMKTGEVTWYQYFDGREFRLEESVD